MTDFLVAAAGYFWREETPYLVAMVAVLAGLLAQLRREDRRTLLHTVSLYLFSLAGQFVAGALHGLHIDTGAAVLHEAFVIAGGIAIIRLWGMLLFRVVLPSLRLAPPHILEDILVMLGYVAWGLVRLRYAGMDLSQIVTTSAVITAVIAFSMQDTLGNVLGGLALQLDESIEIGDWVKVDDVVGRVVDIRWRSTLVETRNWETVVIPNSHLMKTRFLVLGRRGGQPVQWRRWVWFNVDLAAPPARVLAVVEGALREAEIAHVAREPAPNCVLMDFEAGYGRYAVRYWLTDLAVDDPTDTAVRSHVYAALNRAGLRVAVAEYSVHMVKEGEKHDEAVRGREMARRLAALRQVDLFARLSGEELQTVAERLVWSPFAMGDAITRQGMVAEQLYIMTAGEAEVFLEAPGQARQLLSTLRQGSFIGEMGLMTGAPRSATVIAKTDVECYRLDKAAFEDIVRSRPAIAEDISQILVTRRAAIEQAQQTLDEAARATSLSQQHNELLGRIRRFFGLAA